MDQAPAPAGRRPASSGRSVTICANASAARWGRAPGAVATVIDSQSVKAAEAVGRDSRGYERREEDQRSQAAPGGGHQGPAAVRDGQVLFRLRLMHPEITIVWADSGYAGQPRTNPKSHPGTHFPTNSHLRSRR